MAFLSGLKVRAVLMKHQKGDTEGALVAYQQLFDSGLNQASYILPYSVLLLRQGGEANYERVKQILIKAQKASDLNAERKQQLFVNYAVASWKTGGKDKAIELLEGAHREAPTSLTYNTLGFLYVEAGDREKALPFNLEAYEYDDTDPITLDNLAQTYYRLLHDKETAKTYFDRAHTLKPEQIDTLYFLAQYDLDNGDKQAALEKLQTAVEGRFSPLNFISQEHIQSEIDKLKADDQ
ncbi:MAG: hypothetical protein GX810_02140 [Clostridiales bacterium]|nr:hypothetical protein [Clostridiales bacterium]